MASIDDLWNQTVTGTPAKNPARNLDELYTQTKFGTLTNNAMSQPQPQTEYTPSWTERAGNFLSTALQPAKAALEVISYIDKPRGALANVAAYGLGRTEDKSLMDALSTGWAENTSWKQALDPEWVRNNPTLGAVAGFGLDVALDPLNLLTPAKLFGGIAKGAEAIGLTEKTAPLAEKVAQSQFGQSLSDMGAKYLNIGRATDEAMNLYNARNAQLQGVSSDAMKEIENVFKKELSDVDRSNIEPFVQRMVESYPDVGQFARAGDKVGARDVVINNLMDEMGKVQAKVDVAKGDIEKFGALTPDERNIYNFMQENKIQPEKLQETIQTAQTMGKVRPIAKDIDNIDENISIKNAAIEQVANGLMKKEDLAKIRPLFNEEEFSYLERGKRPPKIVEEKPLGNITEDTRQLVLGIKNVPQLAQKITNETELVKQTAELEKVRSALQKADISPEKTTEVIQSALDKGFTPEQTNSMLKISETMRKVNQMMTSEGMKRELIPFETGMEYGGGRHLRRMYAALENPEQHYQNILSTMGKKEADKFLSAYNKFQLEAKTRGITINMKTFEGRKSLPKDLQDELGRLYEASYPFAKGNKMASEQYARYDYLKSIADKYGSDEMLPGYKVIETTKDGKYGNLEGKYLPARVYDETMTAIKNMDRTSGQWEKNVQRWKALKLINPASISRNTMSGAIMANVFGNVPLHKLPQLIADSFMDMKKGTDRYLEARSQGLFQNIMSNQDLQKISSTVRNEKPDMIDRFDSLLGMGMKAFGKPDEFWRMVVYNNAKNEGKSIEEASALANRAMFDYSSAPEWINSLARTGIVPFAKFPYFATIETGRALWNKPASVTKYLKPQAQVNTEDREQIMPEYTKARTLLPIGSSTRMVKGVPQPVESNIDLSYILPFASDISVGNPITDALQLLRTGRNSLGMEIIRPGMSAEEKRDQWLKFGGNAVLPALLSPYTWEKGINTAKGNVDYKGRQYSLNEALAQIFLGIKNVPINIEEMYKSKRGEIQRQISDTESLRRQTQRDQSLTPEQKKQRIDSYSNQIRRLNRQIQLTTEAYKREQNRSSQNRIVQ